MALLGGAGGIGQPLGLLLKMNRHIEELRVYDLAPFTKGVAKDLSHCNTAAKVPIIATCECDFWYSAATGALGAGVLGVNLYAEYRGPACQNSLLPKSIMSPFALAGCPDSGPIVGGATQFQRCVRLQVEGFIGDEELGASLQGADLVVIPAGVPRKPGMTRDDLFNINAGIVKNLVTAIAKHAPNVSHCREASWPGDVRRDSCSRHAAAGIIWLWNV